MKKKELKKRKQNKISTIKNDFSNLDFYIILVEPSGSANIGMIARIMKNFGFKNLVIFNPRCQIDSDARKYSMHARKDILAGAEIIRLDFDISKQEKLQELNNYLKKFNYVIGTSAKESIFRNIRRTSIYIDELNLNLIANPNNPIVKIAILFGREKEGLFNEELDLCDFLVKIPTSEEYPSINLANAVSIILFTIFKKLRKISKGTIIPSTLEHREILYKKIIQVLKDFQFDKDVSERILRSFKNILGRSFSSLKEIDMLITFFHHIKKKIDILKKINL
ncbi:MAG: RNA methyltransferase [Promethearchaeota archaeon]